MKMRKILPLLVLAVGALVLLSGCDAMLDAIFPTTTVTVDVAISGATHPNDWNATYRFGQTSGSVTVQLTDTSSGATYQGTATINSWDVNYIYYQEVSFTGLKDHSFTVTIYYTSYYDGVPGNGYYSTPITPGHSKGDAANVSVTF